MSEQCATTTFKLSYEGRKKPIVAKKVDLLNRLSKLNGKVVKVWWVTTGGHRRLKLVDVNNGILKNHIIPNKSITAEDFCE